MLLDLVATLIEILWPGLEYPPSTSEGILWFVAQSLKNHLDAKAALQPSEIMQEYNSQIVEVQEDVQRSDEDNEKNNNGGRNLGLQQYTSKQVDYMLDELEEVLPCGKKMWELVLPRCNEKDKDWVRNCGSCKSKFMKMVFAKENRGGQDANANPTRKEYKRDDIHKESDRYSR